MRAHEFKINLVNKIKFYLKNKQANKKWIEPMDNQVYDFSLLLIDYILVGYVNISYIDLLYIIIYLISTTFSIMDNNN